MMARGAVSAARTMSSETPRLSDLVASLAPFFSWRASADSGVSGCNARRREKVLTLARLDEVQDLLLEGGIGQRPGCEER